MVCGLCASHPLTIHIDKVGNKKAMLSQGNRAMPL